MSCGACTGPGPLCMRVFFFLALCAFPLFAAPPGQYRTLRLGMSSEQARRSIASDIHTNAEMQRAVGPEHKAERQKHFGKGETISLLFWADRLIEIRVELDLQSPGDAEAYFRKLRETYGPETRIDWRNVDGLEQRQVHWETQSVHLVMTRSARATFLLYEDIAGQRQMKLDLDALKLPPSQEIPGL